MQLADLLNLSLRDIGRHPLRAFLVVLSIAVGIAALVTIVSGEVAWRRWVDSFYQIRGVDVIQVRGGGAGKTFRLPSSDGEMKRFLEAVPAASLATVVADGRGLIRSGSTSLPNPSHPGALGPCRVRGVSAGFEQIFGTRLLRGRFFTKEEARARAPVCIIDGQLAQEFFGKNEVLGKDIRVDGHKLRVIGIAQGLTAGGLAGPTTGIAGELYGEHWELFWRHEAGVVVPQSTARHILSLSIAWLAVRADDHTAAIPQIGRYFGLDPYVKEGFPWLSSLAKEKASAVRQRRRAELFIGFAALLVLLASGIAVASIMYVAVSERQREIGVHRALGATRGAISGTFVLESAWLGFLGGVSGIVLGLLGARYLGIVSLPHGAEGILTPMTLPAASLTPRVVMATQWDTIALAAVTALIVAAAAGFLPASEAGSIDPSQAITGLQVDRRRLRRSLTGLQLAVSIAVVLLLISVHEGIALENLGQIWRFSQADTVYTDLSLTHSSRQMPPIANPVKALLANSAQVKEIGRACPAFKSIEAEVRIFDQPVKYKRYTGGRGTFLNAVTPGYFAAEGLRLVEGRLFTAQEADQGQHVTVLTDAAAGMMDMEEAAGRTIRIGGISFLVVGVVRAGAEGASQFAYIPVASMPRSWTVGPFSYNLFHLRAHLRPGASWYAAQRQFLAALSRRLPPQTMQHLELRGNIPDYFRLTDMRRASAMRGSIIGLFALLIALIGLVNMLLISVAEQTREIGIRRALGATRASIAAMVVLEAMVICLPGCIVGLGLGIAAAHFVGGWAHLSTVVPAFWIVVSAGTALLGGILASLIPAVRAAMLHPVAALRHE